MWIDSVSRYIFYSFSCVVNPIVLAHINLLQKSCNYFLKIQTNQLNHLFMFTTFRKSHQLSTDFSQVLEKHSALLGRVAATYEANFHMRQELLQEITLAVWQALEKFKGDSSVKTYILRVAHNKAITHVAYHAKQPRNDSYCEIDTLEPSQTQSTDQQLDQHRQIQQMLVYIRNMPIQTRQVVTMSMEGLSYDEIADACGISRSNAGVVLNRARKVLMESIKND